MVVSKLDEYGKIGWLTVTVLAFMLAWPAGAAVVGYLAVSGRLQAWRAELPQSFGEAFGTWFNPQSKPRARNWAGFRSASSSGNRSFDEYRDAEMRRLEQEQREFQAFLEKLRHARDKAEFDAFMAEQRQRSTYSAKPE